ncbi:MAG: hypothetical protein GY806_03940 [Gammaproteobacteria bacterium]|nr:hypothetical protein [Gammaproteobacteria bacterium]
MAYGEHNSPIKHRKQLFFWICFITLGTVNSFAFAVDFSLSGQAGVVDNPHQLSTQLDPQIEPFVQIGLRLSNRFENDAYFKIRAKQLEFSDDERADNSLTRFEFGYRSEDRLSDGKINYHVFANHDIRDKNYVSKITGEDATFSGESIVDRYDYDSTKLNANISYTTEQKTRYRLGYQYRKKDYESFSITGLSDFDYSHDRIKFDLQIRPSSQNRFKAAISTTRRNFDDKRVDDSNGDDIAGTDLEYDYYKYSLGYVYRPDSDVRIELSAFSSEREDNGVGYADASEQGINIYSWFQLDEKQRIFASLRYSDFSYDNQIVESETALEEESFNRKGQTVRFDYRRRLSDENENQLSFILTLIFSDFNSSNPFYKYSGNTIAAGIRYSIL